MSRAVRLLLALTIPVAVVGCGGGQERTAYWRLLSVSPDGKTLEISWTHGVGDRIDSVKADESASSVRITVYVKVFQGPRILLLAASKATVHLREPLGERELLHGPANYIR